MTEPQRGSASNHGDKLPRPPRRGSVTCHSVTKPHRLFVARGRPPGQPRVPSHATFGQPSLAILLSSCSSGSALSSCSSSSSSRGPICPSAVATLEARRGSGTRRPWISITATSLSPSRLARGILCGQSAQIPQHNVRDKLAFVTPQSVYIINKICLHQC